jgi:hypothetical protein
MDREREGLLYAQYNTLIKQRKLRKDRLKTRQSLIVTTCTLLHCFIRQGKPSQFTSELLFGKALDWLGECSQQFDLVLDGGVQQFPKCSEMLVGHEMCSPARGALPFDSGPTSVTGNRVPLPVIEN